MATNYIRPDGTTFNAGTTDPIPARDNYQPAGQADLSVGTDAQAYATKQYVLLGLAALITAGQLPITGDVKIYAGSGAMPGWLICDGAAIPVVSANAALIALVGANTPDMRGRFPLGKAAAGTGSTLLGTGGTIDHTHAVDVPATTSGAPSATLTAIAVTGAAIAAGDTHTHSTDPVSFPSGIANPPFVAFNYYIKV